MGISKLLLYVSCVFGTISTVVHAQETSVNITPKPAIVDDKATIKKQPALRKLPPLPADVVDIHWSDFFKNPVGPAGLDLTEKIQSLNGKKVRLLGYMVRREKPVSGTLLLAPEPVTIEEDEAGFADLPPQTVRVLLPYAPNVQIPYSTRPLLLTGVLSVGRHEETGESTGGEVSWFRLTLEKPKNQKKTTKSVPALHKLSSSY